MRIEAPASDQYRLKWEMVQSKTFPHSMRWRRQLDKHSPKTYHLAEEAPICQGQLSGQFGYNAYTPAGKQVLDRIYIGTNNTHPATSELCQVIGDLWKRVPKDAMNQIITSEAWQDLWRKNVRRHHPPSHLHFGHIIAGTQSDIISDIHALKTSLAPYHGIALTR